MKKLLKHFLLIGLWTSVLFSCENKTEPKPEDDAPPETFGLSPAPQSSLANVSPFGTALYLGTMPSSFSLQMPTVGNQGREGSCVAWAVAYAARSYQMPNQPTNNNVIRSPEYVYNQIKVAGCESGSFFVNTAGYKGALNLLKDDGVCSWNDMPYTDASCNTLPNSTQRQKAQEGKIKNFSVVSNYATTNLKGILLNNNPIIIGARLDEGFMRANNSFIWKNSSGGFVGNHAMVVCGYDDSKNAFRIINSWGKNWGNAGYTWLDYNYFANVVFEAYVMQPNTDNNNPNANIALGAMTSSSSNNAGGICDGNNATGWNAGTYAPQWVAIHLPQSYTISKVKLNPAQNPPGNTTHQILVSSDMVNWNVVDTFTSFTTNGIAFERTFANPIPNVRGVRVLTTASPSWVAWFEIEVFGN
jgi:C1A family cysteine protease